jgi:hypothetical protein
MRRLVVIHTAWLLALVAVGCGRDYGDREVSGRIAAVVAKGEGAVVNMREAAPFPWSRMYVFPPYAQPVEIERKLGFPWPDAKKTGLEERDDVALLVFAVGQKVVRYTLHPRGEGDFAPLARHGGYAPHEAFFRVHLEGGRASMVFEPPPLT